MRNNIYREVTFTQVGNHIYPDKQFVKSFFISEYCLSQSFVRVEPLTLGRFIRACIKNSTIEWYWRFLCVLYKGGFIDIPEAACFHWKYLRLNFWSKKQYRR